MASTTRIPRLCRLRFHGSACKLALARARLQAIGSGIPGWGVPYFKLPFCCRMSHKSSEPFVVGAGPVSIDSLIRVAGEMGRGLETGAKAH